MDDYSKKADPLEYIREKSSHPVPRNLLWRFAKQNTNKYTLFTECFGAKYGNSSLVRVGENAKFRKIGIDGLPIALVKP